MSNVITAYNEIWYAQKSIERLEKLLTFAPTITRDFDDKARTKGEQIQLKRPSEFTAVDFPSAASQDLNPTARYITLNKWKGVQFKIRDDELHYSGDEIIQHHIDPSMQAVADAIEMSCMTQFALDIPWYLDVDGTDPINDFVDARKILNKNNVPPSQRFAALNFDREAVYLKDQLFLQANTSSEGGQTQRDGRLGMKMGFDTYTNANCVNTNPGTIGGTPAVNGAHAAGVTTLAIDGAGATGTAKVGDSFSIAGQNQRYVIKADVTMASGAGSLTISPPLQVAVTDGTLLTFRQSSKGISLFYNKPAFTMVMAPLSQEGTMSALIGVATDDQTGLAIRWMRWYDPLGKQHWMSFDALWGLLTTDENRAVRVEGATI